MHSWFMLLTGMYTCAPLIDDEEQPLVFFKQKTAYELRISDWSSDVCSSDLRRIAAAKRLLDGEQALSEVALACGFYDQSHFTRAFKGATGVTPEIGRASCRERVCQYV